MLNACTCNDQLDAITEQLTRLLRGEKAQAVESAVEINPALQNLLDTVNRLVTSFNSVQDYIQALADGDVDVPAPPRNLLASRFKQLQANLLHLTWQTEQIAAGDYSQRVHFMGAFSASFNAMTEALESKRRAEELLREADAKIKHLEGIIPICMYCKKIRDDQASWQQMEKYITEHSDAKFSHGICPECYKTVMHDIKKEIS